MIFAIIISLLILSVLIKIMINNKIAIRNNRNLIDNINKLR